LTTRFFKWKRIPTNHAAAMTASFSECDPSEERVGIKVWMSSKQSLKGDGFGAGGNKDDFPFS